MLKANPQGCFPEVHSTSHIDETAVVIGQVKIGEHVFVGPGAVIRADEKGSEIVIGDNCNIQDKAILHCLEHSRVTVGAGTSLAHACIVHGPCAIGRKCFIGFGTVLFKTEIHDGVIIKHKCCVENINIPANSLINSGSCITQDEDLSCLKAAADEDRSFAQKVADVNCELADGYKAIHKRT
ncbi:MAG: carbonate dehydratase [Candidatus Omnitrophota bacterium]